MGRGMDIINDYVSEEKPPLKEEYKQGAETQLPRYHGEY